MSPVPRAAEGITKRNQRIADGFGDTLFDQEMELVKATQPEPWYGDAKSEAEQLAIAHILVTDPDALAAMHEDYRRRERITDPARTPKLFVRHVQEMVRMVRKAGLDMTPRAPEPTIEEIIPEEAAPEMAAAEPAAMPVEAAPPTDLPVGGSFLPTEEPGAVQE